MTTDEKLDDEELGRGVGIEDETLEDEALGRGVGRDEDTLEYELLLKALLSWSRSEEL